jgi:hypothetical protein
MLANSSALKMIQDVPRESDDDPRRSIAVTLVEFRRTDGRHAK